VQKQQLKLDRKPRGAHLALASDPYLPRGAQQSDPAWRRQPATRHPVGRVGLSERPASASLPLAARATRLAASYPLAQFPNGPLLAALGALAVAALTDGSLRHYARAAFYAALAAWAWDELARGTNWVRRAFGVAGLFYVIVEVGAALGA